MPLLRCPRCSTIVDVAAGVHPVCPKCGFASRTAARAPTATSPSRPPTPLRPIAPALRPAAAAMRPARPPSTPVRPGPRAAPPAAAPAARPPGPADGAPTSPQPIPTASASRAGLVMGVTTLVFLLLVGGAFGAVYLTKPELLGLGDVEGGGITVEELAAATMQFETDLTQGSPDSWGFAGTASFSGSDGFFGESGQMTFEVLQDPDHQAFQTSIKLQAGYVTIAVTAKQRGEVLNLEVADKVYQMRDKDPSTMPRLGGPGLFPGDGAALMDGPPTLDDLDLPEEEFASFTITGATHKGRAATKFTGSNETHEFVIFVYDETKRLASISVASDREQFQMDFLYGKEVQIEVQDSGTTRAAFTLESELSSSSTYAPDEPRSYTVTPQHLEEVPLPDIEMRAVTLDGDEEKPTVHASMPLTTKSRTSNGVTFTYQDVDGDGLVSAGDTYTYDPGGTYWDLEFYDKWADSYEGRGDLVPGFDAAALALALGGLGLAMRRRRR